VSPAGKQPTIVGRNLRHLRKAAGQTQQQLAAAAGLGQSGQGLVSQLENGSIQYPNAEVLRQLASGLGVSMHALFASDPGLAADVRESLAEFRKHELGRDMTDEEMEILSRTEAIERPPSVTGWWHLLLRVRADLGERP
jgi:transcriptional regulator with XRE-family HTH domain